MKLFKKNENKKTTKLPMTGKVKKGFRYYCMRSNSRASRSHSRRSRSIESKVH